MQTRLLPPIHPYTPRPCQGLLSLTLGFLCSPAFRGLHPACITRAFQKSCKPSAMTSCPGTSDPAPCGSRLRLQRHHCPRMDPSLAPHPPSSWGVPRKGSACLPSPSSFPRCSSAWNLPVICKRNAERLCWPKAPEREEDNNRFQEKKEETFLRWKLLRTFTDGCCELPASGHSNPVH